jgi:hypothetical protein
LAGIVLICAITPFNTFGLNNTDTIGAALPTGLVFMLLVGCLVNGLLTRYAPRLALGLGELGLVVAMWLIGCSFPSVGLMRYLPGHLVQYHNLRANESSFAAAAREMNLPEWLWPSVDTTSDGTRAIDPVVSDFVGRIPGSENQPFVKQLWAVPWHAWAKPVVAWGTFVMLLFGAVLCMALVFRRQWVENERIPFPLATVYMSLIEPPAAGKRFNTLMSSRMFWVTFLAVAAVHTINGLAMYDPQHVPPVQLWFNLNSLMTEQPWSFTDWSLRGQTISLTFIGIVYFVDSRVALSIWVAYLLLQIAKMSLGTAGIEISNPMRADQNFGAVTAFGLMTLWLARRHLLDIARQMFAMTKQSGNLPRGRYVPSAVAGWGLVLCMTGLAAWLYAAGASLVGAVVIVFLLMLLYLVLTKVVAETGLIYVLIPLEFNRPWIAMAQNLPPSLQTRTTLGTYFWSLFFTGVLAHDTRCSMATYVSHALRVNDLTADAAEESRPLSASPRRHWQWGLIGSLTLAAVVGFLVSGASWLWLDYTYATSLDQWQETPLSAWGTTHMPRQISMLPVNTYLPPSDGPVEQHNRLLHAGFAGATIIGLSLMRLYFVGWPFHPIGFLLVYTWGIHVTWCSILLGWVAKVTLLRLGGATAYAKAKPLFLGLIVGDAFMTALWIIVGLIRISMGLSVEPIRLLPG